MQSVDHPVIGFRSWNPDDRPGHPFLKSVVQNFGWDKRSEARCLRPLHWHRGPAPAEGCECGLYAFHGLDRAARYASRDGVIGIVRGWGQLRVHKDGWRAQHAEVLAIIAPKSPASETQKMASKRAAEIYRVPLISFLAAPAMASEFGQFVPDELRPDTSIYAGTRGLSFKESVVAFATVLAPIFIILLAWSLAERTRRRWKDG